MKKSMCTICGEEQLHKLEHILEKHPQYKLKKMENKSIKCLFCGQVRSSIDQIIGHMEEHHQHELEHYVYTENGESQIKPLEVEKVPVDIKELDLKPVIKPSPIEALNVLQEIVKENENLKKELAEFQEKLRKTEGTLNKWMNFAAKQKEEMQNLVNSK